MFRKDMTKANNFSEQEKKSPGEEARIPDQIDRFKKNLTRGAGLRAGACVFTWFSALAAYWIQVLDSFSLIGISFSILYLILINYLALWVLRRLTRKKQLEYLALTVNGLEVLAYTAIIYFAGGLNVSYLTLIYLAIITAVGVLGARSWTFIVTGFCSFSFTVLVLLVHYHFIPVPKNVLNHFLPLNRQLFDVAVITLFLFLTAFISANTSQILRKGRKRLREQNRVLEEAMERAQASDRKKSEFLANMSHELRTPLNHIIGFTELVADRSVGPLNGTQEEYLKDVLGSSRHLLSLINDILDLSKVESGKMDLEASEISLEGLLRESLTMVKEKALKHGITLTPNFLDIPAAIRADERKLKQILYNLLSNAVKFTPDGGRVKLEARGLNGQGVRITVSDTGIGVAEDDLERIFQPFEQGDNSAGRKYQGTGLGLSLTKRLVELHGGRLWAESEGPGRGSHFHVLLPQQEKRKAEEVPPGFPAREGAWLNVNGG
jgi:signal transduction histidine kinase